MQLGQLFSAFCWCSFPKNLPSGVSRLGDYVQREVKQNEIRREESEKVNIEMKCICLVL